MIKNAEKLNALVTALGTTKKFKTAEKESFAQALIDQLDLAIQYGKTGARLPIIIEQLSVAACDAEQAIATLIQRINESYEGFFCDGIARNSVTRRLKADFGLDDMQYYLQVFTEFLGKPHTPTRKRGPNNIAELSVAEMVAIKYKQFFKTSPSHNKDYDKSPLPYDRICDVIEKYWGFKIRHSTRDKAVKTAKGYMVKLSDELI